MHKYLGKYRLHPSELGSSWRYTLIHLPAEQWYKLLVSNRYFCDIIVNLEEKSEKICFKTSEKMLQMFVQEQWTL